MRQKNLRLVLLFVTIASVLTAAPLLARTGRVTTSITIVNNSTGLEIRHLYLSPVDQDKWGPDQLNGAVLGTNGGSYSLSTSSCEAATIKVIAEDQNGCFLYQTVSCTENSTWTITNGSTPDCGN